MPWLAAKSGRAAIFGLLSESNEAQNCKANCVQLCRMLIALGEFYSKERKCLQGRGWLQVGSVGSFNILFFLQVIARLRTCIKDSVSVDVCVCVGCLMTVGAVSTCTCIRLLYQKQSVKYEILAAAVVDCAGGMQREREREQKTDEWLKTTQLPRVASRVWAVYVCGCLLYGAKTKRQRNLSKNNSDNKAKRHELSIRGRVSPLLPFHLHLYM